MPVYREYRMSGAGDQEPILSGSRAQCNCWELERKSSSIAYLTCPDQSSMSSGP